MQTMNQPREMKTKQNKEITKYEKNDDNVVHFKPWHHYRQIKEKKKKSFPLYAK